MIETAKVEIRKLQILNDRINQCLEALQQVRMSVHGLALAQGLSQGLSHTGSPYAGTPGVNPETPFGAGFGGGYGQFGGNPFTQGAGGNPGFGAGQGTGINPGFGFGQGVPGQGSFPGLSHTGGLPGYHPLLAAALAGGGLERLGQEANRPLWADPFLAARIRETFPYAQFPTPPVVTIA